LPNGCVWKKTKSTDAGAETQDGKQELFEILIFFWDLTLTLYFYGPF